MSKTLVLFLSALTPVGAWAASANMGPSRLIVQVICAIAVSFVIFIAILRVTERKSGSRQHAGKRVRSSAALRLTPPLPLPPRQAKTWRGFARHGSISA